jgi:hypothetical protein
LGDHTRIQTQIAPVPMLIVHIGPASAPTPDHADLRLAAHGDADAAADAILVELRARGRLGPADGRAV